MHYARPALGAIRTYWVIQHHHTGLRPASLPLRYRQPSPSHNYCLYVWRRGLHLARPIHSLARDTHKHSTLAITACCGLLRSSGNAHQPHPTRAQKHNNTKTLPFNTPRYHRPPRRPTACSNDCGTRCPLPPGPVTPKTRLDRREMARQARRWARRTNRPAWMARTLQRQLESTSLPTCATR